jgi:hypothetical protein
VPQAKTLFTVLGLLGTLGACEMLGPPGPLPDNAQPISPPAAYQDWWVATEACSGLDGSHRDIEWYVVPGASTFDTEDGPKVGLWSNSSAGMRIVLAGDYADSELVVRHEMLHALLDRDGHPSAYFRDRCRLTWDTWVE